MMRLYEDAFDSWWEWANKPFLDMANIPADIHEPVMAFRPRIVTTMRRSTKPCGNDQPMLPGMKQRAFG
jgi:hypothetical protein